MLQEVFWCVKYGSSCDALYRVSRRGRRRAHVVDLNLFVSGASGKKICMGLTVVLIMSVRIIVWRVNELKCRGPNRLL
jgi:hypothetical protein